MLQCCKGRPGKGKTQAGAARSPAPKLRRKCAETAHHAEWLYGGSIVAILVDSFVSASETVFDIGAVSMPDVFGIESNLELEFETHYQRFFMPTMRGSETGSKKRYCGMVATIAAPDSDRKQGARA